MLLTQHTMRTYLFAVVAVIGILPGCGAQSDVNVSADNSDAADKLSTGAVYQLVSVNSGLALDVIGLSTANGAGLQQWGYWGGTNQQWRLQPGANGAFGIINVNSGRALDVPNGTTVLSTNVEQWDWWNGPMQNWNLVAQSDGSFELVNVASKLCLDVANISKIGGARVLEWTCWGGANQRWNFVTVGGGTQSLTAPTTPVAVATTPATSLPAVNFSAAGNLSFNLHDYGSSYQANKASVMGALSAAGASPSEQAIIIAMAMQESTTMSVAQRDSSKDGTPSMNYSLFNVNGSMMTDLGFVGDLNSLNGANGTGQVVTLLVHGIRTWGVGPLLNYQRGGSTAFHDGVSYGAANYRSGIATIYAQMQAAPVLLTDGRRVEVNIPHV